MSDDTDTTAPPPPPPPPGDAALATLEAIRSGVDELIAAGRGSVPARHVPRVPTGADEVRLPQVRYRSVTIRNPSSTRTLYAASYAQAASDAAAGRGDVDVIAVPPGTVVTEPIIGQDLYIAADGSAGATILPVVYRWPRVMAPTIEEAVQGSGVSAVTINGPDPLPVQVDAPDPLPASTDLELTSVTIDVDGAAGEETLIAAPSGARLAIHGVQAFARCDSGVNNEFTLTFRDGSAGATVAPGVQVLDHREAFVIPPGSQRIATLTLDTALVVHKSEDATHIASVSVQYREV